MCIPGNSARKYNYLAIGEGGGEYSAAAVVAPWAVCCDGIFYSELFIYYSERVLIIASIVDSVYFYNKIELIMPIGFLPLSFSDQLNTLHVSI